MKRARGSYEGLTVQQASLLSFLRHERNADRTPSYKEMEEALGLNSKSGVHRMVRALEERGYVDRIQNRSRSLRVYDVSRLSREADGAGIIAVDLTTIPITALLGEIARRTNGQVQA